MLAEEAGKFHHIDRVFANDFGEGSVGDDAPFIGGVLEVVGFDVIPDLFGRFGAGGGGGADDFC